MPGWIDIKQVGLKNRDEAQQLSCGRMATDNINICLDNCMHETKTQRLQYCGWP